MLSRLDAVLGLDVKEDIKDSENEMLRLSKPNLWNVYLDGNEEIKMESDFEVWMYEIQEQAPSVDLDKITVFRFYSLLDYIKNKNSNG